LALVVVGLAIFVASQKVEAKSKRIHVTAEVVQQTFIGDLSNPQLGNRRITNVRLLDKDGTKVGTGAGFCRACFAMDLTRFATSYSIRKTSKRNYTRP
jgi:hypothetical protein